MGWQQPDLAVDRRLVPGTHLWISMRVRLPAGVSDPPRNVLVVQAIPPEADGASHGDLDAPPRRRDAGQHPVDARRMREREDEFFDDSVVPKTTRDEGHCGIGWVGAGFDCRRGAGMQRLWSATLITSPGRRSPTR